MIRLPIDIKSLFYNIKNDNISGHTATVSTVIKQGNAVNEKLMNIFSLSKFSINLQEHPKFIDQCVKNSKATVKINNAYIFNKIAVNGELIDVDASYAIFVKEEVDPTKVQFGRLKMHYPTTLKYSSLDFDVDNKEVMSAVSKYLKDFSFLVNEFRVDEESGVLDFDITILGNEGLLYSKVFINNKGVGNKMVTSFVDAFDSYDMEVFHMRKNLELEVNPDNYLEIYNSNRDKAIEIVKKDLFEKGCTDIKCISGDYPYSLYDLEYRENGYKKYLLIEITATKMKYINLSTAKVLFLSYFSEDASVVLATNIMSSPELNWYDIEYLQNQKKSFNSVMYTLEGNDE